MGVWCNGNIMSSKLTDGGSIPSTPAMARKSLNKPNRVPSSCKQKGYISYLIFIYYNAICKNIK